MSKIAIISDIHSNIHALDSVINHIKNQQADMIVCLGDVIGYGAFPQECVRYVDDNKILTIMGNHELAILNKERLIHMNQYAHKSLEWTQNKLSPESLAWISKLPFQLQIENCLFVHAAPQNPEVFEYIIDLRDAVLQFDYFATDYCFYGHTHLPKIFSEELGEMRELMPEYHQKKFGERLLINVGSVGQPRDGDNRASYCLLDTSTNEIYLHRVNYDYNSASKAIEDAGLPEFLAKRLLEGV
jgi:diadenosine tetraphosphatase ApaH/serine/threonine PP2A family protein phosphatase